MSADNGIYILKTNNEFRVAHLMAIENLYWNKKKKRLENKIQADAAAEMFGSCHPITNYRTADLLAEKIQSSLPICEHGIILIDTHQTWENLIKGEKT